MKIILLGGGVVGTGIARQLLRENNDVTIIDESEEVISRIASELDIRAIKGFPSHPAVLEAAGAANAEMLIAVTTSDEVNIVACEIANSLFNVPIKISRIRNRAYLEPAYKDLYRKENVSIDYIISPEIEVAKAIIGRLHVPGAMNSIDFFDGKIKVTEVRCEKNFDLKNSSIYEIKEKFEDIKFGIISIVRDGKIFIPNQTERIQEGDEIFFVSEKEHVARIIKCFGHSEVEARRVIIVGGGNIGLNIAETLSEEDGVNVKIIEMNAERAEEIANFLPDVTVLNGNALEKDILFEAGIENTETIISVTDDDEVNMLSSILAKKYGCKKSVALINRSYNYTPIIASLGIDVYINPRETTVSSILQHIRKGKVRAAHSIYSGAYEIVEAEAVPHSVIIGKTIADLELPEGIIIFAISSRNGEIIIPDESRIIKEYDRMLILSSIKEIAEVDKIFSERSDFF